MERDRCAVAVLMFDRAPLFETAVPMSVFGVDRTVSGAPSFRLLPVATEPGPLVSTGGVQWQAPYELDALNEAGVVIVPSWRDPAEPPVGPVLDALRAAHADGAMIVGLCLGAFVLAAAGLLDGRRAVTHWLYAPTLAAEYPHVQVDASALFVDEGDVLTSAGTAAGVDACLHLVRRTHGAAAAAVIARRMVVPPQRSGGQAQYIEQPLSNRPAGSELATVLTYALEHLHEGLDIDSLARRAHLSRRSFDRQFRALTGTSALKWLLHQRILRAQHLLECTDLPINAVAHHVGLATGVSLRPHFRRILGVSPQAYRDTFRNPTNSPARVR